MTIKYIMETMLKIKLGIKLYLMLGEFSCISAALYKRKWSTKIIEMKNLLLGNCTSYGCMWYLRGQHVFLYRASQSWSFRLWTRVVISVELLKVNYGTQHIPDTSKNGLQIAHCNSRALPCPRTTTNTTYLQ